MKITVISCDRCGAHNAKEYKLAGPHGRATRDLCDDHAELALEVFREPKHETDIEKRLRDTVNKLQDDLVAAHTRTTKVADYASASLEDPNIDLTKAMREVIQLAVGSK